MNHGMQVISTLSLLLPHAAAALKLAASTPRATASASYDAGPLLLHRRQLVRFAAALNAIPCAAFAATPPETSFEELEKKRLARAAQLDANRKRVKPFLDAITNAKDAKSFAMATDNFAVWLIGEGRIPEGLDAVRIRDLIQDAYMDLPTEKYFCEPTRTNQGIC